MQHVVRAVRQFLLNRFRSAGPFRLCAFGLGAVFLCATGACFAGAPSQTTGCGGVLCDGSQLCIDDACVAVCHQHSDCAIGDMCSESGGCFPGDACGNGETEGVEQCDDRNDVDQDGCSAHCELEGGYACSGTPSVCRLQSVCGNGEIETGEACDDGGLQSRDGCDSDCKEEAGWVCYTQIGAASSCEIACGNGSLDGAEGCDDGNRDDTDGCSSACVVALGYVCDNEVAPSTCEFACGNGKIDGIEGCDDGARDAGDGCSALCSVESGWSCKAPLDGASTCLLIPGIPLIHGERSAGHLDLAWVVDGDSLTHSIAVRYADGTAGDSIVGSRGVVRRNVAAVGDFTLHARACNGHGECSADALFATTVEFLGQAYVGPWAGVSKVLPSSPLGNVVAVSCHNCYNGADNEVFGLSAANAKISRAVGNSAALIEVDVGAFEGEIYVHHGDPIHGTHPTLHQILSNTDFRDSDAMLDLELKETDLDVDEFATTLLNVLNAHQDYARNGRFLIVRGFENKLQYLDAVASKAADYPLIAPYLKFSVLLHVTNGDPQYYDRIDAIAARNFFGVELGVYTANLFSGIAYARSLGLMAGVWTVPSSFGEVWTASLREEVDQLTTEYNVNYTHTLIQESNVAGYYNSAPFFGGPLRVWRNDGTSQAKDIALGITATATTAGSPSLAIQPRGVAQDLFGGVLLFDEAQETAIAFWDTDAGIQSGFLVTAVVNFDDVDLSNNTASSMAIVSKGGAGGFTLELAYGTDGYPAETVLRFGVDIGGTMHFHEYPVTGTAAASGRFSRTIATSPSYFLAGAYDGDGGVYLFVDNKRAASPRPSTRGTVAANNNPVIAGARPQGISKPIDYFNGQIQQVQVLKWPSRVFALPHNND